MVKKDIINPIALLTGSAIGAGFLGMPFVFAKSGFLIGLVHLVLFGLFVLFIQLVLGEVVLRTNGNHHLAGYAEKYLGKKGKIFVLVISSFYIFSALVAYLLASGESLSYIFFGSSSYSFVLSIFFWVLVSCLSFVGLRALKNFGKIGFFIILFFLVLILIFYSGGIQIENLTYLNPINLFVPLGVVMFSFFSFSAIPSARRLVLGKENWMKKVIFLGVLIPFIFYLVFSLIIVGNFGVDVPQVATLALGRFFALLGIVTLFTCFLSLSISIRDLFRFDFGMKRFWSWFLCAIIPFVFFLIIYFFQLVSFIQILSVIGIVCGGLSAIVILLMNLYSKKKCARVPEYSVFINWKIIILVSIILFAGMIVQLVGVL